MAVPCNDTATTHLDAASRMADDTVFSTAKGIAGVYGDHVSSLKCGTLMSDRRSVS